MSRYLHENSVALSEHDESLMLVNLKLILIDFDRRIDCVAQVSVSFNPQTRLCRDLSLHSSFAFCAFWPV
jgi:hypothetical protein